jgi:hypothetical protein
MSPSIQIVGDSSVHSPGETADPSSAAATPAPGAQSPSPGGAVVDGLNGVGGSRTLTRFGASPGRSAAAATPSDTSLRVPPGGPQQNGELPGNVRDADRLDAGAMALANRAGLTSLDLSGARMITESGADVLARPDNQP